MSDIKKDLKKILVSGTREDLDKALEPFDEIEQKRIIAELLAESSSILHDQKLNNVKTRPLLYYLIADAEKRGRLEGKEVHVCYADQRKLGKINNTYGPETGDEAISAFVDSLHKGMEGVKKSNYNIVRMGGDEFCIIVVDENHETIKEYLKEGKTIANTTVIKHDGKAIDEKVDFAFGVADLDLSEGRKLRDVIDTAQSEAYYQQLLTVAEEKAERSKIVLLDTDKQIEKKKIIDKYIERVTRVKKDDKRFDFEIVTKKDSCEVPKEINPDELDLDFIIDLIELSDSKGLKREALIDAMSEHDIEYLKDNYCAFAKKFIRENESKNIIKRDSSELLFQADDIEGKKVKYIELDNLKLVNSARDHSFGDKYIQDFMEIVKCAMESGNGTSYAVKMSGNALCLVYDEGDEQIVEEIFRGAALYKDPNINIPMDVYSADMELEELSSKGLEKEYLKAGDEVKEQKELMNESTQKIILDSDGSYQIFDQREIFTIDEVNEVINSKFEGKEELLEIVENMVPGNYGFSYDLIDNLYNDGDITEEEKIIMEQKVSIILAENEIDYSIEDLIETEHDEKVIEDDEEKTLFDDEPEQ